MPNKVHVLGKMAVDVGGCSVNDMIQCTYGCTYITFVSEFIESQVGSEVSMCEKRSEWFATENQG